MPNTPYAKLIFSLNGGAPQSGAVIASNGDIVQLTAESTAQWPLTTLPRWEIYAYPPGWTGPASGWTTETVDLPNGLTADVYVYLGLGPPPAFTLPALPMWGDFLCKLTVDGGRLNGLASLQMVDDSSGIRILGPGGMKDVAVLAQRQFDPERAYVGSFQDNFRLIADLLVGPNLPYTLTPTTVTNAAGSAGASALYARGDHQHQLTFTTLNAILNAASAQVSFNGQTAISGGYFAPYFATSTFPRATDGLLRANANQVVVAARDDADSVDVTLISFGVTGTDALQLGDTSVENIAMTTKATGALLIDVQNIAMFAPTGSFGSGEGVVYVKNATVVPTTNPTNGGVFYIEGGAFKYRGSSGTVTVLAPA